MAILKNILVGLVAWTVGFGGVAGYVLVTERFLPSAPALKEQAAAKPEGTDVAKLPQPAAISDSTKSESSSPDEVAALRGDLEAARRVLETAAREHAEKNTPAKSQEKAPDLVRNVNATGDRGRSYTIHAPGAVEIPLASSTGLVVPAWRVSDGVYSGQELRDWSKSGKVRFVPNRSKIEVLERQGDFARVMVMRGSQQITGWTHASYIESPARMM